MVWVPPRKQMAEIRARFAELSNAQRADRDSSAKKDPAAAKLPSMGTASAAARVSVCTCVGSRAYCLRSFQPDLGFIYGQGYQIRAIPARLHRIIFPFLGSRCRVAGAVSPCKPLWILAISADRASALDMHSVNWFKL